MSQNQWDAVDTYFNSLFVPADDALDSTLKSTVDAGLPAINVAPNQGKLLMVLAKSIRARRILEVGTLAGYSTIWLARGMEPDGKIITLEIDARHADVARANMERAGLTNVVEVKLGSAHATLAELAAANVEPFDLVFVDADKASTPTYLEYALQMTKVGSYIILDNVVRDGRVVDPNHPDVHVQGIQKGLAMLANDPRVIVTALQTVGSKGYDGLAVALRVS